MILAFFSSQVATTPRNSKNRLSYKEARGKDCMLSDSVYSKHIPRSGTHRKNALAVARSWKWTEMAANRHRMFWKDVKCSNFDCVIVIQPGEDSKAHGNVHFKWMSFLHSKLYLSKTATHRPTLCKWEHVERNK